MPQNKITLDTRRKIADAIIISKNLYHGQLTAPDFLNRIFNLSKLPSNDYRFTTAYDDIHKHMVMNDDWEPGWVFTDIRFNLLHCDDDTYLKFLSETLHPSVRDSHEVENLLALYNNYLQINNFEIIQSDEFLGKPLFTGRVKGTDRSQTQLIVKKIAIKRYLDSEYVNNKITLMNNAVNSDTDLAIGTAKELLETICKSIIKQKGLSIDKDWSLTRLLKETINILNFKPKKADQPEKAETSIKQILGGVNSIVQGIAELRNTYGSGHGKDSDFKGLENKYAKLLVGVVAEIGIFLLATNGESAELFE